VSVAGDVQLRDLENRLTVTLAEVATVAHDLHAPSEPMSVPLSV